MQLEKEEVRKMLRKRFSWAVVAILVAGAVVVSAASALAVRSGASPFELVATDHWEGTGCIDYFEPCSYAGTFTSNAPFCESGAVDFGSELGFGETVRHYTCADGSGSLTLNERVVPGLPFVGGEWTIVQGSGRYADLRGKGGYFNEQFADGPDVWVSRTSMRGFADDDSVAPSVAITSAGTTKLSPRAGTYSIRVALSLRDDVEENPVTYRLAVKEGPRGPHGFTRGDLDSAEGSTASGSTTATLHIWPSSKRVRFVQLVLNASDPVGNDVSLVQWLALPR